MKTDMHGDLNLFERWVLVVEDDVTMNALCCRGLQEAGFAAKGVYTVEEALACFEERTWDAFLFDNLLPDGDGLSLSRSVRLSRNENARAPVLIMTALPQTSLIEEAFAAGATDFLRKPLHLGQLTRRFEQAILAGQTERRLQAYQANLGVVFSSLPQAAILSRVDRTMSAVNEAFTQLLGYDEEEVAGSTLDFLYADFKVADLHQRLTLAHSGPGQVFAGEKVFYRRKDGRVIPGESTSVVLYDENERHVGYLLIIRDLRHDQQRERELAEKAAQLKAFNDHAPEMMWRVDRAHRHIFLNEAAAQWLGAPIESLTGSPLDELQLEPAVARLIHARYEEVFRRGKRAVFEFTHGALDKEQVFQMLLAPEGPEDAPPETLLAFIREVTELRRLHEAQVRTDRLETLGQLAGGIAHDFNNIIAGLQANYELMQAELDDAPPAVTRSLQAMAPALRQATSLAQQLLTFAKGGHPIKEAADLPKMVRETMQFALSGRRSTATFSADEDLWPTQVDHGQFMQVFSNLLLNADEAMEGVGQIDVSLENAEILAEEGVLDLPLGRYVLLKVRDHGTGITEATLERLFDPYFTTKATGHGMGLATSSSILQRHDGRLTARNHPEGGAVFMAYWPVNHAEQASVTMRKPPDASSFKGKRLLLLEDQPAIQHGLAGILRHEGLEVTTVASGGEAIEALESAERAQDPYDVALLDLTIPGGLGGLAVARSMISAEMPTHRIVISGYTEDPVFQEPKAYGFEAVLRKPFTRENLLCALSELKEPASPSTRSP